MGQVDIIADVQILIYVDIDGVLNIGARDPGQPPLLFSDTNLERAFEIQNRKGRRDLMHSVETLISIYNREVGSGEQSTYAEYKSSTETLLCDLYVQRLAKIIQQARSKGNTTVVLSSSWRRPQYARQVRVLEEKLSLALGRPFVFDARTPLGDDKAKEGRIGTIRDHLIGLRSMGAAQAKKLRVLILEDFCITPVESIVALEQYLGQHAIAPGKDVDICLVHTYDSWTAPSGSAIEIGCGLTEHHFNRAMHFLGTEKEKPRVLDVAVDALVVNATQDLSKRSPWVGNAVGWLKVMAGFVCYTNSEPVPQNLHKPDSMQVSL